jgi:RNA polymerase sigma-70 factor (ECF subfamily)
MDTTQRSDRLHLRWSLEADRFADYTRGLLQDAVGDTGELSTCLRRAEDRLVAELLPQSGEVDQTWFRERAFVCIDDCVKEAIDKITAQRKARDPDRLGRDLHLVKERYRSLFKQHASSLAQDRFLALVDRENLEYRDHRQWFGLLSRCMYNRFLDRLRAEERAVPTLPVDGIQCAGLIQDGATVDPLAGSAGQELVECIQNAIDKLPTSYRVPLQLAAEGKKNEEIAEALGVKLGAAKMRLHRARQRLLEELKAVGFELEEYGILTDVED